jgi:hypothetical protein
VNITTVAGDTATFISLGAGNWICTNFQKVSITGSGSAVQATSPTLVTPVLGTPSSGTLTSCTGLPEAGLTLADNTTNDVSTTKHGFAPKGTNTTTKFLRDDGTWANIAHSEVWLQQGNGSGSSSTKIRRYTTTITNTGSDITYADSATLGATFTINTTGLYHISRGDGNTGAAVHLGFSVNSAQLTTAVQSCTASTILAACATASAGSLAYIADTVYLTAGDVVRAHDGTSTCNFTTPAQLISFRITRIG